MKTLGIAIILVLLFFLATEQRITIAEVDGVIFVKAERVLREW